MTIRVTFVDNAAGTTIGEADIPPTDLPETFELDTTLTIAGKEWHVERAEPMTRAEYIASGTLRLTLHAIEHVDPKTILYSLCTIENALPAREGVPGDDAFRMLEDDWRQCELVAASHAADVETEFAAIRLTQESRKGIGYERIHVRSLVPEPLAGTHIAVTDLALGVAPVPLAIGGALVTGGFAFLLDGDAVYGCAPDGVVTALCVAGEPPAALLQLARDRGLLVVDWLVPAILS